MNRRFSVIYLFFTFTAQADAVTRTQILNPDFELWTWIASLGGLVAVISTLIWKMSESKRKYWIFCALVGLLISAYSIYKVMQSTKNIEKNTYVKVKNPFAR